MPVVSAHFRSPHSSRDSRDSRLQSADGDELRLNSTTWARPHPTGPARTFFAARVSEKLRWVRVGL